MTDTGPSYPDIVHSGGKIDKPLDLDRIVDLLHGGDIPAYVEQTGGGCATIYAGKQLTEPEQDRGCYQVVAGPGWFEGINWTRGHASRHEFYIGPGADSRTDEYETFPEDGDEELAARLIADWLRHIDDKPWRP